MGLLRHTGTGRLVILVARSLVGRAAGCAVLLDDRRASGEHAVISWDGQRWELRDLGSLNGTWVDGQRLAAGERAVLGRDATVGFGVSDDPWILASDDGPGPAARRDDTGAIVQSPSGLLALPTPDDPRATIYLEDGHWLVEVDGAARRVADHDMALVDGVAWTLLLPGHVEPIPGTVKATGAAPRAIGTIALGFRVSADEEHVDLTMRWGDRDELVFPSRSSHYLLLTLARARLDDEARGVAEGEQGWLYAADLADMLGYSAERVNIEIFRARSLLARAEVVDAARLVERRPLSRQLRLGVGRLEVTRA